MVTTELTLSVSEFKAKCLDIMKRLDERKLSRVTVTRRGIPVAVVAAAKGPVNWLEELQARMKGSVTIPPGVDIVGPIFDGEMDAEKGILYNE